MNSLIRHSDRVKVACLAQLVNVIAPIMTNENGILRNTIFYPYSWGIKYGRGRALSVVPEGPGYEVASLGKPIEDIGMAAPGFGMVQYVDVVPVLDPDKKTVSIFALNRDLEKEQELEISWHDLTPSKVVSFETLTGNDLKALNTFADPKKVVPQTVEAPAVGSKMTLKLPARSYSVLTLQV